VFSRDEQRTRSAAVSPEVITRCNRRVLMPRDGNAGGTWIAANDAGIVFALLNVNPPHRVADPGSWTTANGRPDRRESPRRFRTRGAVIAQLTGATAAAEAARRACALPLSTFRPFRVLAFDAAGCVAEVVWTGERARHRVGHLTAPLIRTSSGLGDALVAAPRRRLFVRMLRRAAPDAATAQDAFHRHHWPGRGELSVLMSRADATTVSITTVEVSEDGVRMVYEPRQSGESRRR
jgi:hypothetical protein